MFIYCPLSTSVHIEVAMKFCGEEGMILEMDNSKGRKRSFRGIDCSWISRYVEEDERYETYTNILLYTLSLLLLLFYIVYFSVVVFLIFQ